MDIARLEGILEAARGALTERKRLERLSRGYIEATNSGRRSRARTTTYNANASNAAELARLYERDLRRLVLGDA